MSHRRKALLAAAAATALLALAPVAQAREPIVFVHGFLGSASNWNQMIERFRADGYTTAELNPFTYGSTKSNKTIAAQDVRTKIDQVLAATGATKVDVVAHSMGSLNSRWYIKFLGGQAKVDDWVSLGGPNHGSNDAYQCSSTACVEMRPGSSFLTELNAGDETPGTVNYGTWWSPCDDRIDPLSSTSLSGATNTQTGCISHRQLITDPTVYGQVRDFVR